MGFLTIAHMAGAAPFDWPSLCGEYLRGSAHFSMPYCVSKSLKAVRTKCIMY